MEVNKVPEVYLLSFLDCDSVKRGFQGCSQRASGPKTRILAAQSPAQLHTRAEGRTSAMERKVLIGQNRNVGNGFTAQKCEAVGWTPPASPVWDWTPLPGGADIVGGPLSRPQGELYWSHPSAPSPSKVLS